MELCSVEFYVAHAKISRMFNHRAFWNKLNIYQNAWQKKCLHWGGRSLGIPNQAALLNLWVSVYWFIWDLFWYVVFFEVIPKSFWSKREESIYLCCPVWHFSLATTSNSKLVFVLFGMVELPSLSHTSPQGRKSLLFCRAVNATEHGATCSNVIVHCRLTADKSFMFSFCSYSTCRVFSSRMRPLCRFSQRHLAPGETEGGLAVHVFLP